MDRQTKNGQTVITIAHPKHSSGELKNNKLWAVEHFQKCIKYIEDIQMFGVNMTFISSSEVKNCIFHECRRHE